MPTAIIKQPDRLSGAINGLAGAFHGMNEGEAELEKQRQYNETLALDTRKVKDQEVQWDQDMEYRYKSLRQLADQNQLDRDQQEQFHQMEDSRAREMQKAGFDFEKEFTTDVVQPFQAGQQALDRQVTRKGQDLVHSADMARTRQQHIDNTTQLDERSRELQSERGYPIRIAADVLGDRDFLSLTPEEQQAAIAKFSETDLGRGRISGSKDIVQATPEEIAKSHAKAVDVLSNLPQMRQDYYKEIASLEAQKSAANSGLALKETGSGPLKFTQNVTAGADGTMAITPVMIPYAGVQQRDPQHMTVGDREIDNQIWALVASAKIDTYGVASDSIKEVIIPEYEHELDTLVGKMDDSSQKVRDYYKSGLANMLLGDPGTSDELTIDNSDQTVVGD